MDKKQQTQALSFISGPLLQKESVRVAALQIREEEGLGQNINSDLYFFFREVSDRGARTQD